jgi:hypothetical protein
VAPQAADAPLALPDKPSIAVLPFQNKSGDPEQEYFTDGITEDVITELASLEIQVSPTKAKRWMFELLEERWGPVCPGRQLPQSGGSRSGTRVIGAKFVQLIAQIVWPSPARRRWPFAACCRG